MDQLQLVDDGSVRRLVLDRPERRNALTVDLVAVLADAVRQAPADGVRALIITGTDPAFCAGGDLDDLSNVAEQGALAVADTIYTNFHGLVHALSESPLPVLAAVNGPAMGAGLDLALACDLRYASEDAMFASSWIQVGLVPGMGGAWMLPAAVTSARAAEMLLTGMRVPAERALEWGLVTAVTPHDGLLEAAQECAERMASMPATAVARTKASLRRYLDHGRAQELAAMGGIQGALLTASDFQEAAARFRR